MLLTKKALMELLGIGFKVMLLSHHHTCKGGKDLCRNFPRLQKGNLIFNHFETQYSLPTIRP
jgi:hypothetical protein